MPEVIRKWGRKRDFQDVRDFMFRPPQVSLPIPEKVDLSNWRGPIRDQGDEGSCTGQTGAQVFDWIARRYLGRTFTHSAQFLYDEERILDGSFPEDAGSQMRTICKALVKYGCCLESDYPYRAGDVATKPTEAMEASGRAHRQLGAYHRLASHQDVLLCLGDVTPWPVMLGFSVFASFMRKWPEPGVMPIPEDYDVPLGGHAVWAVGYDQHKHCVLIQNSWGADWGSNGGQFLMPYEVVDDSSTDLFVCHLGGPWKSPA